MMIANRFGYIVIYCKPYFPNKYSKANTDIVLNENGDLILKDEEIEKNF